MKINKRQYQQSIEELAENYHNLLSLVPCHIYWKNTEGVYLGCNYLQAKNLGLSSPDELVGKTDFELPWAEQAVTLQSTDKEVMKTKQSHTVEEEVILADGTKAIFLSKKAALLGTNGEVKGVIGISFDISEQKKLMADLKQAKEHAELANQAKTEFLSNMRHDIRTPLTGIVGFSELLKSESKDPRIKEYADNLIASSNALHSLMNDILDAIKISSGEIPLLKKKFNLSATLKQVIDLYTAKACEKKIALSLSIDSLLPEFLIGDKVRIHRIALELVSNALGFTNAGQVSVHAELAKKDKREIVLKLIVTDTGIGISKDLQQDIYIQFKRLTPSFQGIYQGSGLGLYIVKQFIQELESEIYVNSEPGKGSTFTCLIPLQEPLIDDAFGVDEAEELIIETTSVLPLTEQVTSLESVKHITNKLLVVEDNYIAQAVAKALLSAMDCQVDIAANGIDALALCESNQYDLIFMDIGLGAGIDGYEVTRRIRNKKGATQHIPIIALTAHAGDESKQRCIEAGIDAVLTKPLTQIQAREILNTFISSRHEVPSTQATIARRDLPDSNEEMFHLNQFALFDSNDALKNCGSQEVLIELLKIMIQELPADLERIKNAYNAHDYPLVEKTAHKIKGGAVYIGTIRVKYACQYLERYWKSGQRELFETLYQQAVNTIEETCIYIKGWLSKY